MKDTAAGRLEDIARRCGVSVSTVSRVMNGDPRISTETRKRVMEAASRARYTARRSRRHLSRARIRLTVVVPGKDSMGENIFFDMNELLLSLNAAFSEEHISVETVTGDALEGRLNADGVIIAFGDIDTEAKKAIKLNSTPCVFLNRTLEDENYVSCNNFRGMMTLGRHLYDRGLRTTGYMACPSIPVNADRFRGYRMFTLESAESGGAGCVLPVESIESVTRETAGYFIENGCDSVMCFNDNFAIRLIGEFQKMGVDVPGRISVTGFDDSPARRVFRPLITTMSLSTYEMGFFASRWLRDAIHNREIRPLRLEIDGAFMEGETVRKGGKPHGKG